MTIPEITEALGPTYVVQIFDCVYPVRNYYTDDLDEAKEGYAKARAAGYDAEILVETAPGCYRELKEA